MYFLIYLHNILERREEEVLHCIFYRIGNWDLEQVKALTKDVQLVNEKPFPGSHVSLPNVLTTGCAVLLWSSKYLRKSHFLMKKFTCTYGNSKY